MAPRAATIIVNRSNRLFLNIETIITGVGTRQWHLPVEAANNLETDVCCITTSLLIHYYFQNINDRANVTSMEGIKGPWKLNRSISLQICFL